MLANLRHRFLDLRTGEGRPFLFAFLVLALTIAAHTIVETARGTLFLAKLPPERLAYVYVTVAAATLIVAPFSAALVRTVGARNALVTTLIGSAYGIAWF